MKWALFLLSFIITSSCSDKDDVLDIPIHGLGGDTWAKGPLDHWLDENFVTPYNIEVKYRFDRYEVALNRTLTPPREDKVITVMEAVKKTWIEPYEQVAGPHFIKKHAPKLFVLVGSMQVNPNRTITLGFAEGGRKIVLFKLNDFDKKQKSEVTLMLETIQHEFAHMLHMEVMYPQEYRRVTTDYTASWADYSLADARSRGYISKYARQEPNEDFAEMVSQMLIMGRPAYDGIVNSTPPSTQALFRRKEEIIVRYFKETWNIDFYALQTRTQLAISQL